MQAQIFTFVIPAMALIFAIVLGALWWQRRDQLHILAYSYCFGSMAAGVVINIWIMGAIGPIGIVGYHLLSMSGIIAMMWGASKRAGQNVPILAYSSTVVVACALLGVAGSVGDIPTMKLVQNTSSGLLLALAAQNLWHTEKRHLADSVLVWVLALFSGFGLVRPVLTDLAVVLFGQGEQGLALLTSLHALVMTVMITLMALCLISSVIADNMAEQREQAAIDVLSGLRIRHAFESQAEILAERARAEKVPLSLIVADIDHFKRVNDRWGHPKGDAVIEGFGTLIASTLRPDDIAGRLGGEEFGILVWDCPLDSAALLAERLREKLPQIDVTTRGKKLGCTASFGVTDWRGDEDYLSVFKRADAALYKAKNAGRDQVFAGEAKAIFSAEQSREDLSNVIPIPKQQ